VQAPQSRLNARLFPPDRTRVRDRRSQLFLLGLAALTVEIVLRFGRLGDYPADAGPAVKALAGGHLLAALRAEPLMGMVSILLRAPAVALVRLAGAGEVGAYRAGAVACLLPAAWLAMHLVASFGVAAGNRWKRVVAAVLVVAGPASVAALQFGHPEEVLAGSLVVGAVALAARKRPVAAGLALGLAVATKQWALVAIAPSIAAAPRGQRARLAGIAAAAAAAFVIPVVAADASGFVHMNHTAASTHTTVTRTTIWFLFAAAHVTHLHVPAGYPSELTIYGVPQWVGALAHPLVVLAPVPLVALFAVRKRQLDPMEMLGVLALAFLLRCVLDPVDNAYYHVPLLLSLVAWEVLARARLPVVSALTAAAAWVTFDRIEPVARPEVTNAFYLAWTAGLATYVVYALLTSNRPVATPSRLWIRVRALSSAFVRI
jgi:hypothetical protein